MPHLVRHSLYLQEQAVRGCAPIVRISSAPIIIILRMVFARINRFHGLKVWNNAGIRRAVA
jgi:hypothetical protein